VTGVLIHLFGEPEPKVVELPPLVVATGPTLNLCDQPIASGRCISLVTYKKNSYPCGGLLAYQGGSWQHVNACEDCYNSDDPCPGVGHRSCDDPQPELCMHGACVEPVDIEVPCTNGGAGQCCGCCWIDAGHASIDDARGWTPTQKRWAK
jgi:hypothetical protein